MYTKHTYIGAHTVAKVCNTHAHMHEHMGSSPLQLHCLQRCFRHIPTRVTALVIHKGGPHNTRRAYKTQYPLHTVQHTTLPCCVIDAYLADGSISPINTTHTSTLMPTDAPITECMCVPQTYTILSDRTDHLTMKVVRKTVTLVHTEYCTRLWNPITVICIHASWTYGKGTQEH